MQFYNGTNISKVNQNYIVLYAIIHILLNKHKGKNTTWDAEVSVYEMLSPFHVLLKRI